MKGCEIMIKIIKKFKYLFAIFIFIIMIFFGGYLKLKLNHQKDDIVEEENILELKDEIVFENSNLCTVDIKGAIKEPGVYLTECNKTVNDVILLAGGLLKDSDTSMINLAKKINDEMVIVVYTKEEVKNSNIVDTVVKIVEKECVCPNIQNDGCINDEITDTIGQNKLININIATLEELLTLPGIGEAKARAIIKYRLDNNGFKEIAELLNVDGIGSKLYEEIKIYITI